MIGDVYVIVSIHLTFPLNSDAYLHICILAKSHALLHTCCHIILPQFVLAKSLLSTYIHMHDVCILVCMRMSFFVRSVSPHNKGIDIDIMHWCVKDD